MDEFIDPLGDDSDLLAEKGEQSSEFNGFCNNPSHNHSNIDPAVIPQDIKNLPKLMPFVELTHSIADIAATENKEEEEQEAIIYSLIGLIGKEQFDKNLAAARHHQRSNMWEKVADIYEEILGSEILGGFSETEEESSTLMVVLRANMETLIDIAKMNRDIHIEAFEKLHGDYDTSVISPSYSFRKWEDSAYQFVLDMKSSLRSIVKTVNAIFDKISAKNS